jgi:spore coat polysaccharide biosynthesis predicted glycosyltransferase SpsG
MQAIVRLVPTVSPSAGRGHLARALALAESSWPDEIDLEMEMVVSALSPREQGRADAASIRLVSPRERPSPSAIVVIDGPDASHAAKRFGPNRLVVFDDAQAFNGRADLVVQPSARDWRGPGDANRVVAGYEWIPIGASWRRLINGRSSLASALPPTVLVCFGGSDPNGVTARLGPAVAAGREWMTTIVVGYGYAGSQVPEAAVVRDPPDLAERMAVADLAVISAGTLKFEVAAIGTPALLVGVADDQLTVGPAFASTGAARWLGDGRRLRQDRLGLATADLVADHSARQRMAVAGPSVVDGRGGDRLAAAILAITA